MDEEQVRKGRVMLWIALAGAVVAMPALFKGWTGIFLVSYVVAMFGGAGGIREVARGSNGSLVLMYAAIILAFLPGIQLLPIVAYLHRGGKALEGGFDEVELETPAPRKPAPRPAAARPAVPPRASAAAPGASAPSTAPRPPAAASHALSGAIAVVKHAGLAGDNGAPLPDGASIKVAMKLPDGSPMPEDQLPVARVTSGTFLVMYYLDQGGHYAMANQGQLAAAGITVDDLHRIGVRNLAAMIKGKPGLTMVGEGQVYQGLVMGGQFEASLVLVDPLWDGPLAKHTPNGAVVAIPSRDVCAFCDGGYAAGVEALRTVAERVSNGGENLLTPKLFERRGGRWHILAPKKNLDEPLEFKL